jgi:putative ABC transport system permease protein
MDIRPNSLLAALRHAVARLRAIFRGGELDRDFSEEIAAHLEMATEENIRNGMSREEARRQAALRLGGATSLQSRHRDERGFPLLEDLVQDLRFAARLMIKDRWFSGAAIAAIALGIGANTVGFTIVNAAFLRGFPFEEADRLRAISWRPNAGLRASSSYLDLEDWRSQTRSFSGIAAYSFGAINISDDRVVPEQTQGSWVTANHFDVLRQRPVLGRTFVAGDEQRGAEPVVIIGYEIWKHRFDLDPQVVGRILRVNGLPTTIIGVMPERMKFPDNAGSELWLPFVPTDAQMARDRRVLGVFGRLAPGISETAALAELDGIAQRVRSANPDQTKGLAGAKLETFVERFLGGAARPMLITVMGAVILVLLIACGNVANLLLSRAMYRAREVAVRRTLGATRWRIVRQLLIESIALSSIGGVFGLGLAWFGVGAFDAAIQASGAPFWLSFTMDYRVLMYVAAVCITTGVVFGLAPALQTSNASQHDAMKEGARGSVGSRRANRFGYSLIVGELALTVVLLCGAGLMLRSFIALYATEPGFVVDGLLRARTQLPPAKYPAADDRRRFHEQLLPRLEAIPGVQNVALATGVPPLGDEEWRFEVDGQRYTEDEDRWWTSTVAISPRYFDVLGVAINRGRALTAADGAPGAENVVISEAMAMRYFPGDDPIGRRIKFVPRGGTGAPSAEDATFVQPWRTIVGVSAPFLQGSADEAFRSSVVYVPLRQSASRRASVVVRSNLPPGDVMTAIRAAVQSIDVDQPVFNIETVAAIFENERLIFRIFSTLFGLLAGIGLVLSSVGIYGVMAYAVTQRTQEIGVRMAIGARRWDVTWLFLRRGLVQLALGLGIGLPAALGLASVARFQLVEIEPSDPVTMIGITIVVMTVALIACVLPARRAARVDPMNALRAE